MMRKLLHTLLFLLTTLPFNHVFAQSNVFDWAIQVGNAGNSEYGESVATDASGNIYATGWFSGTVDFDPGPGVHELSGISSNETAYVLKLNANGGFEWAYAYNLNITSRGYDIVVDDNGFSYIAGTNGIGSFILTMDSDGNVDDSRNFTKSAIIELEKDVSGNIYATGFFYDAADFDPSEAAFNVTPEGDNDIFVLKLNSDFELQWAKTVGSIGDDRAEDLAVDANGNVYITGYFEGMADFDSGAGTSSLTPIGNADAFITKLDANGDFVWVKQLGGPNFENANSIANYNNNLYVTGRFQNTVDFDPNAGTHELTATSDDAFVLSLNNDGEFQWVGQIGGSSSQRGISITTDKIGNVYTSGLFAQTTDFDFGAGTSELTSAGGFDIYVQKLDPNGNFIFAKQAGGTADDYLHHTFVDDSFNILTTGRFQSTADFDPGSGIFSLTSAGNYDAYIQKLESVVHIPDANFKAALLANTAINTKDDGEISYSEAESYVGAISFSSKGISDVTGIEAFPNIITLSLQSNNLTSIDLSFNTKLTFVALSDNNLQSFDGSNNPLLTGLFVNHNEISSLNISANTLLKDLLVQVNQLTSLDVSHVPGLERLLADNNNITALNLSTNTSIDEFKIHSNPNLSVLNLRNGNNENIFNFDVTNNPSLSCISVDDVAYSVSNWTNIDVSTSFNTDCRAENEITFDSIANQFLETGTLTLSATSSSGLPVTFEVVSGPASLTGNELTFTGIGTVVVKAIQSGDDVYKAASPVEQNLEIQQSVQTITFNPIENQFLETGSVVLSASTSSELPITYEVVSGAAMVNGSTLTLEDVGQVTIKATQAGDDTYAPAESVEQSFEIILVTGLPEQRGPQFKFYPNPVSNTLTVIPSGSNNHLSLRNTHGQTVFTLQSISRGAIQLDVSSLPLGIYVLQVANKSGISQTKILKK